MREEKENNQKQFDNAELLVSKLNEEGSKLLNNSRSKIISILERHAYGNQQTLFKEWDQEVKDIFKNQNFKMESEENGDTHKVDPVKIESDYRNRLQQELFRLKREQSSSSYMPKHLLKLGVLWEGFFWNRKKRNATLTIEFFGFLLPKKFKEEALGDIYETRHDMKQKGWSKASIFWITFGKIAWLLISSFRTRLNDVFDPEKEQNR